MARWLTRGEVLVSFLRASFSPKSYFPPVWFAEADDSHLTDDERAKGAGADSSDGFDEQHYDKHREYARRVYRQDEGPEAQSITEAPASIEALAPNTEQPPPSLAAFKSDLDAAAQTVAVAKQITADAIAKAQQQIRDDEEALILILSQIL